MNILCISYFDNGGQMQALSNALNKYTDHSSTHLNFVESYLKYEIDVKYSNCSNESLQSIINNSNFFIFSELIPEELKETGLINRLNRHNTIIRCYGSICRQNVNTIRNWWNKEFITFTAGGLDPSFHPKLGFIVYHIPNLYNFDIFPKVNQSKPIKICHASTNVHTKSTHKITNILNKLKKRYKIEPIIISKKSWKDSLKIKANCHITVDQFKLGVYASSAIESMFLNHVVVSNVSPLVRSFKPDLPIVQATEHNLYSILECLILNKKLMNEIGQKSYEFVKKEHYDKTNIIKWNYLIKWVSGPANR